MYRRYIVLSIILLILVQYYLCKHIINKFVNNKYLSNSYVNSLPNHAISEKRLEKLYSEFSKYNLPEPKINKALHYKKDEEIIRRRYPNIEYKNNGSYGLTASFIQFLEKAINDDDEYIMWYEDDAIPTKNKDFKSILINALKTLPKSYNDIYYFGYNHVGTTHRKCDNKKKKGWKRKTHCCGTHAILFTKDSIKALLKHYQTNTISLELDHELYNLHHKKYISGWEWIGHKAGPDHRICGLFDQDQSLYTTKASIIRSEAGWSPYVYKED